MTHIGVSQAIKALQEKLDQAKTTFTPRSKFTFKSTRKNPSAISLDDAAEIAAQNRKHVPGYRSPNSSLQSSLAPTPQKSETPPPDERLLIPTGAEQEEGYSQNDQANPADDANSLSSSYPPKRPTVSKTRASTVSISHQSYSHIILPSSTNRSSIPATLAALEGCVVDTSFTSSTVTPFASLTIRGVKSSLLIGGAVDGASHVTSVENSTLVLIRTGQLRLHKCTNVTVYVSCRSHPVIEDCEGLIFAPLPKCYVS